MHTIHRGRVTRNARSLFTGLNAEWHVENVFDLRTARCREARTEGIRVDLPNTYPHSLSSRFGLPGNRARHESR